MTDPANDTALALREHSRKALGFMIGSLLTNGEPALLAQARQARSNAEQAQCYDAIRELRLKGQPLKDLFIAGILEAFDTGSTPKPVAPAPSPIRSGPPSSQSLGLDSLGVVKDAHLEQQIAVDNIASRASHQHREALLVIGRQLARRSGSRRVDIESLPIAPQRLAATFMESCNRAGVEPGAMLMFSRLFTRFVIDELAPFYEECKALLPPEEEQPSPAAPVHSGPDTVLPSAAVNTERDVQGQGNSASSELGWDTSRTPLVLPPGKAMAMPLNQLDDALAQVQETLLDPDKAFFSQNPKAGVQPLPLQELINEALAESGLTRPMSIPADVLESMRLLRLLFEHALRDSRVPPSIRRITRLLEVPLLRLSLREPDVLSSAAHPARQLFSELFAAAAERPPAADAASDDFPRLVQLLVMRLLGDYDKDSSIFGVVLQDLRRYLAVHGAGADGRPGAQPAVGGTAVMQSAPRKVPIAPPPPRPPASPEFITLVDKIPLEGWIELRPRGAPRQRLQLVGRVPRSTTIVFADETGQKAGEWSRNDLASMIENGEAVILKSAGGQPPGRR